MRLERPLPVDGQPPRISELWAWTAVDPLTDTEGIVSARFPRVGEVPLVTSMERLALLMGPVAEEVIRSAQDPKPTLHLRHFVAADQ